MCSLIRKTSTPLGQYSRGVSTGPSREIWKTLGFLTFCSLKKDNDVGRGGFRTVDKNLRYVLTLQSERPLRLTCECEVDMIRRSPIPGELETFLRVRYCGLRQTIPLGVGGCQNFLARPVTPQLFRTTPSFLHTFTMVLCPTLPFLT